MNISLLPEDSHARDLRKGRFDEYGRIYLLTSVTHNRIPIFAELKIGRMLVDELRAVETDAIAQSIAWVVMPDHLHWLVALQSGSLSALMQRIKGRSAISINRMLGCHGQIWQRGFHDNALRSEEDVHSTARYVVANPLRAGLVNKIGDYPLWDAIWLR